METLIYKGEIKLKFVEGNHSYWVATKKKDGTYSEYVRATGVTTYLNVIDKPALKFWVAKIMHKFLNGILTQRAITLFDIDEAKGLHTKFKDEAATTGTKVHDWIERFVKGENPSMPEEDNVTRGVTAFLDWVTKHKVKFLESEKVIYSKKYGFCGTVDAIAKVDGKICLVDYKTSTGLYDGVMLQTAAYSIGYKECYGDHVVTGRWAIRLEKRSEEQFRDEMDEKGKVNEPYQAFEAVYLDHDKTDLAIDFDGFLATQSLTVWKKNAEKRLEEYKTK